MRALYWEQVDIQLPPNDPVTGKEQNRKITRVLKSDNPLVTHVVITGAKSPGMADNDLKAAIHIISGEIKPGLHPDNKNVKRFNKVITADQVQSLDIPEAIEWINNLKPEE